MTNTPLKKQALVIVLTFFTCFMIIGVVLTLWDRL